jgi:hypothetical protein
LRKKIKEEKKPFWFKNLTVNQVAAANMIFPALQEPTVRDQLNCINYIIEALHFKKRPPSKQQLTAAIEYSRRSDLAFLWYLYKSVLRSADEICSQKKFTYNERVVLSCICHLDMMVTLRQLEKILPEPVDDNPKFLKNPVKILTPKPDLKIYDLYKDSYFAIENEANRWFERDFLVPSKHHCWAQKLVAEQMRAAENKKGDDNDEPLCSRHAGESSKLGKFLDDLRQNKPKDWQFDQNLSHLPNAEQKITCDILQQFQTTEDELKERQEKSQTQVIATALVNQFSDDAFNRRYLHLCENCDHPATAETHELQLHDRPTSYDARTVKYFHRASINSDSFKFDYDKIFSPHFLHDRGSDVVKKSINAALELNKYLTVDNAITACLRDMWRAKLAEWNERRQAEIEQRQQRVVADCSAIAGDKERVYKLLRQGLALMRKNPKFVLAALPHADRLPILKEWMMLRYRVNFVYEDSAWGK